MLKAIHPLSGVIGFLTILTFWTSTLYSEFFGTSEMIVAVKDMVLRGLFILVPAMAVVGASGMAMGRRRKDAPALAKKRRMPIIAVNGLLVLVPAAFFLSGKANEGDFDAAFYVVQAVELIAGAVNLFLMGCSIRDGRAMTARKRQMAKRQKDTNV